MATRHRLSAGFVGLCLFLALAAAGCLVLHAVRDVPSETQRQLGRVQSDTATLREECAQMRQFLQSPLCTGV